QPIAKRWSYRTSLLSTLTYHSICSIKPLKL
ncbi:glycosyl hydrolase 10 family protein, partial [Vibrio parahaemolyticus AQ3810]